MDNENIPLRYATQNLTTMSGNQVACSGNKMVLRDDQNQIVVSNHEPRRTRLICSAFSACSHIRCSRNRHQLAHKPEGCPDLYPSSNGGYPATKNEWLDLPSDWPGKARTKALTLRASGLFILACTACRYIAEGQDPEEGWLSLYVVKIMLHYH
jgi:hypothetical protein